MKEEFVGDEEVKIEICVEIVFDEIAFLRMHHSINKLICGDTTKQNQQSREKMNL